MCMKYVWQCLGSALWDIWLGTTRAGKSALMRLDLLVLEGAVADNCSGMVFGHQRPLVGHLHVWGIERQVFLTACYQW